MRTALTRYFKKQRGIDLIKNKLFLRANMMFTAMTKANKEAGLGEVESYPPIEEGDMKTLVAYIRRTMHGDPDAKSLQQIVVFYIIYYLCLRGRENLCQMTVSTFGIAVDPENILQYVCIRESMKLTKIIHTMILQKQTKDAYIKSQASAI